MTRVGVPSTVLVALFFIGCQSVPIAPLRLRGVWVQVSPKESVSSIAKRYGADEETIAELNDLPRSGDLSGRAEIFVPKKGGKMPGSGRKPPKQPLSPSVEKRAKKTEIQVKCGSEGRPCLMWPADGKVSSHFGARKNGHHDGLDIVADRRAPVRAAADGRVLYSGDEIKGYGNLVIIRHHDGIITVYAHNDSNLVKEGETVKRGQKIANVGNSGSAAAIHLHFEVRVDEQPRDPLLYLPSK